MVLVWAGIFFVRVVAAVITSTGPAAKEELSVGWRLAMDCYACLQAVRNQNLLRAAEQFAGFVAGALGCHALPQASRVGITAGTPRISAGVPDRSQGTVAIDFGTSSQKVASSRHGTCR